MGIRCPFCGEKLDMEYYQSGIKGKMGKTVVFCNNDRCNIKPCTDATSPSKAFKEAELFGKIK
ncbi:hypothetical protein V6C27_02865 [Peptococcaceae bacterium 1198_IL3148]